MGYDSPLDQHNSRPAGQERKGRKFAIEGTSSIYREASKSVVLDLPLEIASLQANPGECLGKHPKQMFDSLET